MRCNRYEKKSKSSTFDCQGCTTMLFKSAPCIQTKQGLQPSPAVLAKHASFVRAVAVSRPRSWRSSHRIPRSSKTLVSQRGGNREPMMFHKILIRHLSRSGFGKTHVLDAAKYYEVRLLYVLNPCRAGNTITDERIVCFYRQIPWSCPMLTTRISIAIS